MAHYKDCLTRTTLTSSRTSCLHVDICPFVTHPEYGTFVDGIGVFPILDTVVSKMT